MGRLRGSTQGCFWTFSDPLAYFHVAVSYWVERGSVLVVLRSSPFLWAAITNRPLSEPISAGFVKFDSVDCTPSKSEMWQYTTNQPPFVIRKQPSTALTWRREAPSWR